MFNRIFLILICILSLGWIFYVGYDVFYKTDRLDPELIFSKEDQELLIINRTDEFFSVNIPFQIHPEISDLVRQFIETPRNERIFLSKTRPVILIESPNYWNKNSVITYLNRKNIPYQQNDESLLIGDFQLQFKYHFLLIAPKGLRKNHGDFTLPKWDKKATAVIVHQLKNSAYLTEIYLQTDGQIIYQTTYDNQLDSEKVDDKNLFAPYLPAGITSYHFYEKKFALNNHILTKSSPMNEWLQYGFVLFDYNGVSVIMTDSKIGEDPLNTLNTKFAKDTLTFREDTPTKEIKLTETFPSNTKSGFYLTRIGDKVIFSESLNLNKKIVADYELGNTLLLNDEKAEKIYGKLPYKVVERLVSPSDMYAVSTYANISTKHLIQVSAPTIASNENQKENDPSQHFIIPVNGTVSYATGKGNQQYLLTSTNQLIAINSGKITWQKSIPDKIIGDIKIVDYEGNGKVYLLFNTAKKLFLLTEQGTNILDNMFAPKKEFVNEANLYRWKNQTNLIYIDEAAQIKHCSADGKSVKSIPVTAGNTTKKIEIFAQNGRIIGLLTGEKATQTIDLSKNRSIKNHPVIPSDALRLKAGGSINFFDFQDGKLIRSDYTSSKTVIDNFPDIKQLKSIPVNTQTFVTFISYHKLHIYNENGNLIRKIDVPVSDLQSYDICFINNKLYAAFLDGLENKISVADGEGKVLKDNLEGKNYIFMSVKGNTLNLLSEGNGYAVQYYNVLQP